MQSQQDVKRPNSPEALYLELLKNCLTRYIFDAFPRYHEAVPIGRLKRGVYPLLRKALAARNLLLARPTPYDPIARAEGGDWPPPREAETLIGLRGLYHLEDCITDVLRRQIPGDLIEAGVWRGGATIFMRAVLKAYGDTTRSVWVADSFEGPPKPNPVLYPADASCRVCGVPEYAAGLDEVKANFARYGLLDERVRFLVGWFRDTLPTAPIERLAVLRIDASMYESTMDCFRHLYPKLSVGGYAIIDNYGRGKEVKKAVDEFRATHGITGEMRQANRTAVYWQKSGSIFSSLQESPGVRAASPSPPPS